MRSAAESGSCSRRFAPGAITAYYHPLGARRSEPYNHRLHLTLGYKNPNSFERKFALAKVA